ncbi:MAG: cell division protein SepF [Clostridia bacterium]|nr:cell division protein SepF [Clostridia bacterium]
MGFFKGLLGGKNEDNTYDDPGTESSGYYDFDDTDNEEFKSTDASAEAEAPAAPKPQAKPAVSLKLVKPYSPREATGYIDMLKENCIVVIDISALNRDGALRLIDYLSGAIYALDGDLKKTNQNTLVVAPKGVDISSMIPAAKNEPAEEAEPAEQA